MTIDQALNYIHGKFRKGAQPGLHRISELMQKLGDPQKQLKTVHIAGTNGKGSTAAMMAAILHRAGFKTGLFTSPFIYRFNERIQINGQQIPDADVVEMVEVVKAAADTMAEPPTEFEVVCAMGFTYFLRQHCDIVVLECGMGGEKDATNVVPSPEAAVITNIGLDHTDALGDTLEQIAAAKAGIFKPGCSAVIYRGTPGVEDVFARDCARKGIELRKADFDSLRLHRAPLEGQVFDCGSYRALELPLLGHHQLHNAAVVLATVEALRQRGWQIREEHVREGMRHVSWPGRFDIVGHDPLFIIDGGHNPQCIDALVKNIRDYLAGRRIIALTGVLTDKDYAQMYAPVMPLVEGFVCITPPNPRKLEAAELARHLRAAGANAAGCATVEEGVRRALELAGTDGVVLCFGSLYTIGAIREALDVVR
ncbi:MAG: bifunctional folylpolyglutamate synthase/dihydrofolate synthase [Oscillospiraceae bacterium]|nr:bifunctional folylpolyglutamate synthase/dihydrofolate synthase [Oscillospiraceae bacterium]